MALLVVQGMALLTLHQPITRRNLISSIISASPATSVSESLSSDLRLREELSDFKLGVGEAVLTLLIGGIVLPCRCLTASSTMALSCSTESRFLEWSSRRPRRNIGSRSRLAMVAHMHTHTHVTLNLDRNVEASSASATILGSPVILAIQT
ncbi:hypothetical protein E2C01_056263 [Portunus trituberculatus]|uniref:Uncharacterized protein n=1 Tax=Portunus trituberculatus TaxID=210409 RepID=A0A5B7GPV9_PORTR|nr:hypothetical protein [Portunus trituberculatus]